VTTILKTANSPYASGPYIRDRIGEKMSCNKKLEDVAENVQLIPWVKEFLSFILFFTKFLILTNEDCLICDN